MAEGKVSDPSLYSLQRRCDNGFIGQTGANPRLTDSFFYFIFYIPPLPFVVFTRYMPFNLPPFFCIFSINVFLFFDTY